VGFTEAAVLEWLEHRDLTRDELRDLLIQALRSVVEAAHRESVAG
jgi:20S proteasome alpha/beta subunit